MARRGARLVRGGAAGPRRRGQPAQGEAPRPGRALRAVRWRTRGSSPTRARRRWPWPNGSTTRRRWPIALRARQLARSDADGNAERLVLGGRMLALGERTGDPEDVLWGRLWRFDALLQAGRVTDAETELAAVEPVVAVLRRLLPRLAPAARTGGARPGSGPLRRSPRAERGGRRDRRAGRALRCVGDRPFAADRDSGGHRGRPGRPGVAAHAPVPDGADGRVDAGADDPPAPRPGRASRGAGVVREPARGRRARRSRASWSCRWRACAPSCCPTSATRRRPRPCTRPCCPTPTCTSSAAQAPS